MFHIFLVSSTNMKTDTSSVEQVEISSETFFKISNVDQLRPFFMSIVSDSNHWLFIGSNGGLSAGRKNSENALFPYYTDDKIIESAENTGHKSIFQIVKEGELSIWEPFSDRYAHLYKTTRNLYKNEYGNKVLFEEVNHDLNLTYRYEWNSSNTFGFIKKSTLMNNSGESTQITLLDGLQNLLPYGVGSALQNQRSNLVDAYKRSELQKESGIGIFALSAIIVDIAEPRVALKANIAWSTGLKNPAYLLSSLQLDSFREGKTVKEEYDIKAERCAYFVIQEINLGGEEEKSWQIITNVNHSTSQIAQLSNDIKTSPEIAQNIQEDIDNGTLRLVKLNAASDGLQFTEDKLRDTRHFANSLFNIMRGGIFDNNFEIEKGDFIAYLANANTGVLQDCSGFIDELPDAFSLSTLKEALDEANNKTLLRLSLEYLPLRFSRRHGDPSRPWNQFSINTRDENTGAKILDYEGNWRDIFQNWEALAHSYPEFIDGMIFKFLNASTFDGYNPYRVTKNGIDWETIEPDDPWSYIGYWGDHQIIYLLKFLEFIDHHDPNKLKSFFDKDIFVYANVPYKIKPYADILKNPKDTIEFDHELDLRIKNNWDKLGSDSALLTDAQGAIIQVNFIEKLLATFLAKLSNFIPEGGIWMNTERPEWNDANNALVGNGVSMVTLYYLRRFLSFMKTILENDTRGKVKLSSELKIFYSEVKAAFNSHKGILDSSINDTDRKTLLDKLGKSASEFRLTIYKHSFNGQKDEIHLADLLEFVEISLLHLEHAIEANKRQDGLYHAYNLMTVDSDKEVSISYLSEMLEGQEAILSSGYLSSSQAVQVLDGLKTSALFREDQYSYILYPDKDLPGFTERNNIPNEAINKSALLAKLVEEGNTQLIDKDINGILHFNGSFHNANDVKNTLNELLNTTYSEHVKEDYNTILEIFEEVFNHKAFTGRSGTFFGYEGLGSIYWHMVSKLLLAVQECCLKAINENEDDQVIGRLLEHYYEINQGIGVHKSPELYGAFPTDPYSHTPAGKGAQQPGMTGQVKEDILCRFGELGVFVKKGRLYFNPQMLRKDEFLTQLNVFKYIDIHKQENELTLAENSLCFTYCQVPIVYTIGLSSSLEIILKDGKTESLDALSLNEELSKNVFGRTGLVVQINATINEQLLK